MMRNGGPVYFNIPRVILQRMMGTGILRKSLFKSTNRLLSSSCLGLPCRILNTNHKKELLRSLWVQSVQEFVNQW